MSSASCISASSVSLSFSWILQEHPLTQNVPCFVLDQSRQRKGMVRCSVPDVVGSRVRRGFSWRIAALPLEQNRDPGDEETVAETGVVVFRRNAIRRHYEVFTSLEKLGLRALSSQVSRTAAMALGLKAEELDNASTTPVFISWDVTKEGRDLRLDGVAKTAISAICNRCLAPMAEPISGHFSLLLTGKPVEEPTQERLGVVLGGEQQPHGQDEVASGVLDLDLDDKIYFPWDSLEVDVTKYMRDTVHLEIPSKSICRDSCQGLCLTCGVNRNNSSCKCSQRVNDDTRWGVLDQLRRQLDDQNLKNE